MSSTSFVLVVEMELNFFDVLWRVCLYGIY